MKIYASDPWYAAASASLSDLVVTSLGAPKKPSGNKTPCEKADLDGNKKIDIEDLLALLGKYGSKGSSTGKADTNGDKTVDIEDLLHVLGQYGAKC